MLTFSTVLDIIVHLPLINRCSMGGCERAASAPSDRDWIVRRFRGGDAPAARRLIETVWHEHFHRHPDPFVRDFIYSGLSDVDSAETAYGDRAVFLCAICQGEMVGTGAIKRIDRRVCEMVRLFVASTHRRRGIGRTIADELIGFARLAGYERIRLASNNALVASHRLYESLGFQPAPCWDPGGETRYYSFGISDSRASASGPRTPG
jgi:GNAT superfamily N-acetyltransferase